MSQAIINRLQAIETALSGGVSGGGTKGISVLKTFTRPADTTSYTAGDYMCGFELTDVGVAGDRVELVSVDFIAGSVLSPSILISPVAFPAGTENSSFDLTPTEILAATLITGTNLSTNALVPTLKYSRRVLGSMYVVLQSTSIFIAHADYNGSPTVSEDVLYFKYFLINYGQ